MNRVYKKIDTMLKKGSDVRNYNTIDVIVWRHGVGRHIDTYNKISMLRSCGGIGCIALGIGTTLIPFTTAPLIMLGSYLLGYDSKVWMPKLTYKLKLLSRWIYCNRSAKKLYRTIKTRVLLWN